MATVFITNNNLVYSMNQPTFRSNNNNNNDTTSDELFQSKQQQQRKSFCKNLSKSLDYHHCHHHQYHYHQHYPPNDNDELRRASWPITWFQFNNNSNSIDNTNSSPNPKSEPQFFKPKLQTPLPSSPSPPPSNHNNHCNNCITPSVIISDHSLINFDPTEDEDEDQAKLRRDSLSSIYSSTSSLSSLGEDDSVFESSTSSPSSPLEQHQTCLNPKYCNNSRRNQKPKTSPWRKVRCLVTSPFIQTYKRQKYPWIQLAGHQGNFLSGQIQGTILKKLCGNELDCFEKLMLDQQLCSLVPKFKNSLVLNGESYLVLQDLLATFVNPCVMDIKMGIRTYLEEELEKAKSIKLRKDMYEKMVAVDPAEPTLEENEQKAITKTRYMIWRETISSTSTLGFRIDGIKLSNKPFNNTIGRDLKRTKSEDAVRSAILEFTCNNQKFMNILLDKLKLIRERLLKSEFFHTHEMIGSSLLFVHDDHHADIWLIDFAKTYPLPNGIQITHKKQWQLGNHEDGYLIGLDNLIRIFQTILLDSKKFLPD